MQAPCKVSGNQYRYSRISVPNIFNLGNVSIKPQILQAAEKAIQFLDISHFQNRETLKKAPTEESKTKYFEQMTKQQQKLNDIAMAIAAYSTNTNSQVLKDTFSSILKSNLEIPSESKDEIKKTIEIDTSMKDIDTEGDVEGANIGKMKEGILKSGMEKIKTKGSVKGSTIGDIG
jgi:hypothetical protein